MRLIHGSPASGRGVTTRWRDRHRAHRGGLGLLTAIALAAALTSCGDASNAPESTDPAASVQVKTDLHDRLPADVTTRGSLRVVTDASYPPAESFANDGRTIVGFDPDLATALGKVLGVDITISNVDFGKIVDFVAAGNADIAMSAMTDTAERERQLDFVNYFSAGTSIVVQRGNPHAISDIEDLCGQVVAVESGTTQQDLLARQQRKCVKPMEVQDRPTNDDALVLLRTGRAVAILMDFPPAESLTIDPRTHAQYELATTTQFEPGLYGIGVAKNDAALRDVLHDALTELVTDGVYRAILDKWGVGAGAVSSISLNAAGGS